MRARLAPWILAVTLGSPWSVLAQTAPTALAPAAATRRRELLETAARLRAQGDHAHALESATAAGELAMTPSVRMFIADEHLALGHDADAWTHARACVDEATAATELNNRERILGACNEAVAASEARIARVVVRAPANAPPDTGVHLGAWSSPLSALHGDVAFAPGRAVASVTVAGFAPWQRELDLRAGQRTVVDVVLAPASSAATTAPAPIATVTTAPSAAAAEPPRAVRSPAVPAPDAPVAPRGAMAPWILGGVGVAATVAGGVLLGVSLDLTSGLHCSSGVCDRYMATGDYTTAAATASASYVTLGAGVAMIGSAALWLLLGRPAATSPRAVAAWAQPAHGGLVLGVGGAL